MGFADGPNLYAYLHHSPLSAFDAYGLVGEAYRDGSNVGANSNYFDGVSNEYSPVFGDDSCDKAYDAVHWFSSAAAGIAHGCFDFCVNTLYDFQSLAFIVGCDELGCSEEERLHIQQTHALSQANQIAAVVGFVQNLVGANPASATYQNYRAGTLLVTEIRSLAIGGFGAAKGLMGAVKTARIGVLEAKVGRSLLKQDIRLLA